MVPKRFLRLFILLRPKQSAWCLCEDFLELCQFLPGKRETPPYPKKLVVWQLPMVDKVNKALQKMLASQHSAAVLHG